MSFENILKTDSPDKIPKNYINYNLTVAGYSSKEKLELPGENNYQNPSAPRLYNLFSPLIKENLPPNTENLLIVTNAKLQGLTSDQAFLLDEKGNMIVLKEGDRVYLGYLTRIDKSAGQVEFTLNKGGFLETVVIGLK